MASARNAADDASTIDMEGITVVMLPMSMQSDFVTILFLRHTYAWVQMTEQHLV